MALQPKDSNFQRAWRPGRGVITRSLPHRHGVIISVRGTGVFASVSVALFGHGVQAFLPGQLALL